MTEGQRDVASDDAAKPIAVESDDVRTAAVCEAPCHPVAPWVEGAARRAYTIAWWLAMPLVALYLLHRSRRQPAYRQHWRERLALFDRRLNTGNVAPTIWLHAVSVGETRAAQPLVSALLARYPDHRLLLTHMTPTGRETGAGLFGDRVEQCYLPYDIPLFMNRFLRHFQPAIGLVMETELWPNLTASAQKARVPLLLVNARLSERSLAKGLRSRWLIAPALARLHAVLAQTQSDAARLARLGRADVPVLGNIKFDIEPDTALVAQGRAWRAQIGRPVVMLASSRDGEEEVLLEAWRIAQVSDAVLAIVPRHPQRFEAVRALMMAQGGQHKDGSSPAQTPPDRPVDSLIDRAELAAGAGSDARYVLGNSMGEMSAWFGMADVVVMGGSLLPFGGQNLIEPCACGLPVIVGASTFNFEEAAAQAIAAGAAHRVMTADQAVHEALALLADADRARVMRAAAVAFTGAHRGATQRSMAAIAPVLAARATDKA